MSGSTFTDIPQPAEEASLPRDAPDSQNLPVTYRASPVQARFWLVHELRPEVPVCNLAIALRLNGPLDRVLLRRCVDELLDQHESLRTQFNGNGADVVARVGPTGTRCPWSFVDLSASHSDEQQQCLQQTLDTAARRRFDLARSPLLRATLVQLDASRHVLLLVAHHIAVDGTAMFNLLPTELCARYDGTYSSSESVLSCADLSHARLVADGSEKAKLDVEYWRQKLSCAPTAIDLPIDRAYPPTASMNGGQVDLLLSEHVAARVQELAARLNVRPFDIMCGTFVAQLMRYSGTLDTVIGSPVANRSDMPGLEHLIACCIDTQLLRVTFDVAPTFADIVQRISTVRREARRHSTASIGRISDSLADARNARDQARNAVFQVMFNYMPFSVANVTMTNATVEAARYPVGIAMLDLSLDVIEQAGGYQIALEYNADVFEPEHARRLLGHYVELLQCGLNDSERALGDLQLLPATEVARIQQLSRGPVIARDDDRLFHEMLWERAKAHPDAIALSSDWQRVSYAQMFDGAQRLAGVLTEHGVGPGGYVAVQSMKDPVDTLCAMFATWIAGGVVLPLDAGLPDDRLQSLIRDSGAQIYIATSPFTQPWAQTLTCVRPLVSTPTPTVGNANLEPTPTRPAGLTPRHPAYVIYTSGSSGRPKGVIVSHENLANQLVARLARYDEAPERMLAPYSFAFDSFLAGVTLAFAHGATLRLLSDEQRRDPMLIRDVISAERITHLDVVPSMHAALLAVSSTRELASLRVVVCGGESMPASLVAEHWRMLPSTRLYNEYGPTEATVFASAHEIAAGIVDPITPIGRPNANGECWLLDRFGALAPLGHRGELVLGGLGIALGYQGREKETQARFGAAGSLAGWLYRSGDVARYRHDGALEFLGRVDNQVQVRGYRVEPAEIEAALKQQPHVTDAAVILRDENDQAQLVAYVTTDNDVAAIDPATLTRALRATLPSYMIPSAVVVLEALPRTANGKLDRAALPAPPTRIAVPSAAPTTSTERALVDLWERVLGVQGIGMQDSFFDSGGHSMLAVQLISRIESRFGQRVSLVSFFRDPTPAGVVAVIESRREHPKPRCIKELRSTGGGIPLVFVGSINQAQLLAARLDPVRPVYGLNMFGLYEVGDSPSMTVEWITEKFLQEVREVIPDGPYALAGYCEDGKVAFEMARRLRQAGHDVPLLALIDAVWALERPTDPIPRLSTLAHKIRQLGPGFALVKARQRVEILRRTLFDSAGQLEHRARKYFGLTQPLVLEHEMMVGRYLESLHRHQCSKLDDHVVLYLAQEWCIDQRFGEGTRFRQVTGLHERMFESPQIDELARQMDADLAAADALLHRRP